VNAAGGNPSHQIIPLRESQLYLEDWIGLKSLDEAGKLSFGWCDGEHMQFSLDDAGGCWDKAVRRWVGSDRRGQ
jgi:palmitoyl-protein thioesterase